MSEYDQSPVSQDDFRKIKGVGEVTAQALYKLGIRTYAELAQFTSANLVELLRGKIPDLSLHRIEKEDWPGQAQSLLDGTKDRNSHIPGELQNNSPHRETWRELADFFISFGYAIDAQGEEHLQTKIHHSQADQLRQWDGIASDELIAWMLKQADLPELAPGAMSGAERALSGGENMQMENKTIIRMILSDVRVDEVRVPADPMGEQSKTFLRIESQLTLLDEGALNQTFERAPYSVEVYLIDLQTHQSKLVSAYSDSLTPGSQSYQIIQDIHIPDVGRYQPILFARLLPPWIGIAQAQGPLIRVEA